MFLNADKIHCPEVARMSSLIPQVALSAELLSRLRLRVSPASMIRFHSYKEHLGLNFLGCIIFFYRKSTPQGEGFLLMKGVDPSSLVTSVSSRVKHDISRPCSSMPRIHVILSGTIIYAVNTSSARQRSRLMSHDREEKHPDLVASHC
jgi:hypothetical protein